MKWWHNVVAWKRRASRLTPCPQVTAQRGRCVLLLAVPQGSPAASPGARGSLPFCPSPSHAFISRRSVVWGCPFIYLVSTACGGASRLATAVVALALLAATAAPSSSTSPCGWAERWGALRPWRRVWTTALRVLCRWQFLRSVVLGPQCGCVG